MIAKRLIIAGRVQGVGYRDWIVPEAERLRACMAGCAIAAVARWRR